MTPEEREALEETSEAARRRRREKMTDVSTATDDGGHHPFDRDGRDNHDTTSIGYPPHRTEGGIRRAHAAATGDVNPGPPGEYCRRHALSVPPSRSLPTDVHTAGVWTPRRGKAP